jgi:hypothetical protein
MGTRYRRHTGARNVTPSCATEVVLSDPRRWRDAVVDPKEIFELIIKADEKLKYATDANRPTRERQARALLEQALAAAREIDNAALIRQAEQRLTDLGTPPATT